MKGARDYATMFASGQHGRLYLVSGQHARGKTFHIWVLPSEEPLINPPWMTPNAVEVYGITGGNPGWSETYGWLHQGKWEQDFAQLVIKRQDERAKAVMRREQEKVKRKLEEQERIASLLATY